MGNKEVTQLFGVALSESEMLNFCLSTGLPLDEIESMLTKGISMQQIYFSRKEKEITKNSIANMETLRNALEQLRISVCYNQLTKKVEIFGLPECFSENNALNALPVFLLDFFSGKGVKGFSTQNIGQYIDCVADINRYNPVSEYLLKGVWDRKDRISRICSILGIEKQIYKTYVTKWLIQCVALGLNDSKYPVGAEGVLVLQGAQGSGKTSFFRTITPNAQWFVEGASIDVKDKDTVINALRGWITELGELDGTLKKEQSALKAFITQRNDFIRVPYAKEGILEPRRTSFCGTVNQEDYLRDETGSRRFWTIRANEIDKKALFSLSSDFINQLWYQAYFLYSQDNNAFRLTEEELAKVQEDNKAFTVALPYELEIKEKFNYNIPFDKWEWWRAAELAEYHFLGKDARLIGKALNKISEKLKKHKPKDKANQRIIKLIDGYQVYYLPLKHSAGWIYPKN